MNTLNETTIAVEAATAEAFAPFGELVVPPSGPPVFKGIQASSWPTGFHCADAVQVMFTRFGWQEPSFSKLERHRGVTQTFVALVPRRFVMVVAARTEGDSWPAPGQVRAFMVPPGSAVIIGDEVWHALDRFLLEPEPLDCLMLTSSGVQAELEGQYRHGTSPTRTDVIDFAEQGIGFRLEMGKH